MTVEELLAAYVAEHRADGDADPLAYLSRAESGDRTELAVLIDAYLERTPRAAFDEAAYRSSQAPATVEALERSLAGVSGLWPSLLPHLRSGAGLKRRELVARLARALGQQGREEKVAAYYHEMEQGLLPSEGVSDRVLEALASLTGSTLEALREAGRRLTAGGGRPASEMAAFARAAIVEASAARSPVPGGDEPSPRKGEESEPASPAADEQWDEVDELFRGDRA